jgi:tetratricopeptide (TPR) repeat protein
MFLLALLAGCAPSGPRALFEGKRLLDEGKYSQAIEKLKTATASLGGTNALAWNYLGLAYHHADEAAEAERAYQRALALDHDLNEARYNLGCLWLEQNRLEAAKAEFTACTLRRPNVVEGFLKLGSVQLRTREPSAAEKSFSDALRLSSHNPEALNGLGLARLQRGRPGEAAQCFDDALKQQPDYRPALLNLAIVSQQYLKDRQLALEKYREYLASSPPPENAQALMATVRQLEQELNPPARPAATNDLAQRAPRVNPPRPAVTNVTRLASVPKTEPPPSPPRTAQVSVARLEPAVHVPKPAPTNVIAPKVNAEVVRLPAEPVLKPAQDVSVVPVVTPATSAEPLVTTSSVPASATEPTIARRGFFQRVNPLNLLHSGKKAPARPTQLAAGGAPTGGEAAQSAPTAGETASGFPSPSAGGPAGSYAYRSPPQPAPGDRPAAERAFAQGLQAYEAQRWSEAVQDYRLAARLDPSLYAAHYNLGLAATRTGNLPAALAAYEDALAVDPSSPDARYNLALVLKKANYIADAAKELEKLVATHPNDTRAHLALGNLYAQQLHQPAKARPHYLKVLELEPRYPQARDIRYWLAANPP